MVLQLGSIHSGSVLYETHVASQEESGCAVKRPLAILSLEKSFSIEMVHLGCEWNVRLDSYTAKLFM